MPGTLAILLTALAALAITALTIVARKIERSHLRPPEIPIRNAPPARTRLTRTRTMTGPRRTQAETRSRDEHAAVLAWRFQKLVGIGFEPDEALRLAGQPSVDCHALARLVSRGCPPRLAVRIVSPTAKPGERTSRV